jgi:hypothetical protein
MNEKRLRELAGIAEQYDHPSSLSKAKIKTIDDLEAIKNRIEQIPNDAGDVAAFKVNRDDYYSLYDFVYNVLKGFY